MSVALGAQLAACGELPEHDEEGPSSNQDNAPVVISVKSSALIGARTIARNYVPPRGPQGVADSPAFSPSFTTTPEPEMTSRIAALAGMGASIRWACGSWSGIDLVDELNGQPATDENCQDPPRPPDNKDSMWEHHQLLRKAIELVPGSGVKYCIATGIVNKCRQNIAEQTRHGVNSVMMVADTPRAYSRPECLVVNKADSGLTNSCAPAPEAYQHLEAFVRYFAREFKCGAGEDAEQCANHGGKLTDFIAFNEVSASGYFNVHGAPRPNGRAGTIDVTSPALTEADKRAWGSEYAKVMLTMHDALVTEQRDDVMLWASFNQWFRDQYDPAGAWLINNQYILDALKSELGYARDWGIAIHPYGDPNTDWRITGATGDWDSMVGGGLKTGLSPERYVFENLNELSQQMKNWLHMHGQPEDAPQSKLFASEQGYEGPRVAPFNGEQSGNGPSYNFPLKRDEERMAEWLCRTHAEVVRNPSLIAVTHRSFQSDVGEQIKDQNGAKGQQFGLVASAPRHSFAKDRAFMPLAVGDLIDMNDDGINDATVVDSTTVRSLPPDVEFPITFDWQMPAPNTVVLDAYKATFDDAAWGHSNGHKCCTDFYQGCADASWDTIIKSTFERWNTTSHHYSVTGLACADKRDAPVWVDVWAGSEYVTGGPANQSNGNSGRLGCANNYAEQRYTIEFTRDQIKKHAGKTLRLAVVVPTGGSKWINASPRMPSLPSGYNGVTGRVDELVVDSNNVTLRGWACAKGTGQSILVDVYSSSLFSPLRIVKSVRADFLSEPALQAQCADTSSAHRFEISFTRAEVQNHQNKSLYVFGISPVGGTNDELPRAQDFRMPRFSNAYQAPGSMNGRVELLEENPDRHALKGWACMHGDPRPITLHVYSGDNWSLPVCAPGQSTNCLQFVKAEVADALMEPQLVELCGNQGNMHRFEIPFTKQEQLQHDGRRLHVFALHPGGTGPNPVLPRLQDFTMPSPVGPEFIFGDVVTGATHLYEVWQGNAVRHIGPGTWQTCPAGYVLAGSTAGFWVCAKANSTSTIFVGDTELNVGFYYKVEAGIVRQLQDQSWDTCLEGSRFVARNLEENGFWLCRK